MSEYDLALRYSKALFQLASSSEEAKTWLFDLELILKIVRHRPLISHCLSSPHIAYPDKEKVLTQGLKLYLHPVLVKFMLFLMKKNRFSLLADMITQYRHLIDEKLGVLEVQLMTPFLVEDAERNKLKAALERLYGREVWIQEKINPDLIGGGVIILDDRLIDFSLRKKLFSLKKDLLSISV